MVYGRFAAKFGRPKGREAYSYRRSAKCVEAGKCMLVSWLVLR